MLNFWYGTDLLIRIHTFTGFGASKSTMGYSREEVKVLRQELLGLLSCVDSIENQVSEASALKALQLRNEELEAEISRVEQEAETLRGQVQNVELLKNELLDLRSKHSELGESFGIIASENEALLETNQKLSSEIEGNRLKWTFLYILLSDSFYP